MPESIPNPKLPDALQIDRFVLDTVFEGDILKATMNRYRPGSVTRRPSDPGSILLLAHGMGFHKEHWEPTLEDLFALDKGNTGATRILEAWSLDYPSHGEAAELNEEVLSRRRTPLTIHSYTNAFCELYKSGLLGELQDGVQKVMLVGHSAGSVGLTLMTTLFDNPELLFDRVVLVDPTLWDPKVAERMTDTYRIVEKTTPFRRNKWASKQAAYDWFRSRPPWSIWDPRVLQRYTEHGLRSLPTAIHKGKTGVVLRCEPTHEAHTFTETDTVYKVIEHLGHLCVIIPFHIVFGGRYDMFSREAQDSIINDDKGRVFASVTRINGAGHMIVQEKPTQLAEALYQILCRNARSSGRGLRSKL